MFKKGNGSKLVVDHFRYNLKRVYFMQSWKANRSYILSHIDGLVWFNLFGFMAYQPL